MKSASLRRMGCWGRALQQRGAVFAMFTTVAALASPMAAWGQAWHNTAMPKDVNNNGGVFLDDALVVVNELHAPQIADATTGFLPVTGSGPPYIDVTADGFASPADALSILNDFSGEIANVPVAANAPVGSATVRLQATDINGNSISTVNVGEDFLVQAWIDDTRPTVLGGFASYVDVSFDDTLVAKNGGVIFDASRIALASGNTVGPLLSDVGSAFSSISFSQDEASLFASIPFQAVSQGSVSIEAENGYALLYGMSDPVTPGYIGTSLLVVPEPASLLWSLPLSILALRRRIKRSAV